MMTLDDRLAKLDDLRAQRKEIDDEILALFGISTDDEPEEKAEKRAYKKSNAILVRRPQEIKLCCGSKGSRHFKTCHKYGSIVQSLGKEEDEPRQRTWIDRGAYDAIREAMHDKEFQSARYALVNKLQPSEVNRAVVSVSYEEYQKEM